MSQYKNAVGGATPIDCSGVVEGCQLMRSSQAACIRDCGDALAVSSKNTFKRASGRQLPCATWVRNCTAMGTSEADCKKKCNQRPVDDFTLNASGSKRVVRVPVAPKGKNANFMMATGRAGTMSDFLHEVGLIVVAVGVWYYVAAPILKKVGLKPLNI